jgi:FkbM family methyltransferase
LAKLLWETNLCYLFTIKRKGYKLRFYPTSLSASLWVSKEDRIADELFLSDYLKRGSMFVDIGANIGTHSLKAAFVVGPSGKIISFEPHPKTFYYLNKNIRLNAFDNIETHNCALGDKSGHLNFSNDIADDQNCIVSSDGIKVEVKKLEDAVSPRKIDLIKIDVEGYELFVLRGGIKLLKHTDCIMFESSETSFNKYGYAAKDILKLFKENGFTVFRLTHNKLYKLVEEYDSTETENMLAVKNIEGFLQRTGYEVAEHAQGG